MLTLRTPKLLVALCTSVLLTSYAMSANDATEDEESKLPKQSHAGANKDQQADNRFRKERSRLMKGKWVNIRHSNSVRTIEEIVFDGDIGSAKYLVDEAKLGFHQGEPYRYEHSFRVRWIDKNGHPPRVPVPESEFWITRTHMKDPWENIYSISITESELRIDDRIFKRIGNSSLPQEAPTTFKPPHTRTDFAY